MSCAVSSNCVITCSLANDSIVEVNAHHNNNKSMRILKKNAEAILNHNLFIRRSF